jgi:3-oxoacyl-[acyl-carrier protein] reductase
MQVDLDGRHALVTGGGSGIGRSISIALARCGATVIVNFLRSADGALDTVAQIENFGGKAMAVRADVTDETEVRHLVQRAVDVYGGVDLLVSNAGGPTEICPTHELSSEGWDRGLGLNCKSVFYCVKHVIPLLPDHRGRIIVTSSISARSGGGLGMITYAAGKGAVNNLIRAWAKELAPRGITVNAIAPGVIWTRIHQELTLPDEYHRLVERIPLRRGGLPEDCVGAVLLLAAPEGSYVTGQIIEVNGGLQMP